MRLYLLRSTSRRVLEHPKKAAVMRCTRRHARLRVAPRALTRVERRLSSENTRPSARRVESPSGLFELRGGLAHPTGRDGGGCSPTRSRGRAWQLRREPAVTAARARRGLPARPLKVSAPAVVLLRDHANAQGPRPPGARGPSSLLGATV